MKVVFISREFPPARHSGGIGTYTTLVSRMLAKYGHEVYVIANGPEARYDIEQGVHVHRIPMGSHPLPQGKWLYTYRKWVRQCFPKALDAMTWAKTVWDFLRQNLDRFQDVDIWEWPETNGEGCYLHRLSLRGRRFARIHTSWLPEEIPLFMDRLLLLHLQKKACLNADIVVSPSKAMALDYAHRVLKLKGIVQVSPNPFMSFPEPLSPKNTRGLHILYVGRIEYRKGVDLILQAIKILGRFLSLFQSDL